MFLKGDTADRLIDSLEKIGLFEEPAMSSKTYFDGFKDCILSNEYGIVFS